MNDEERAEILAKIDEICKDEGDPDILVPIDQVKEVIELLENSQVKGKQGYVKLILKKKKNLIKMEDISSCKLNVITQKWYKLKGGYKVVSSVGKKKAVSEITDLESSETKHFHVKYCAGDFQIQDIVNKDDIALIETINDIEDDILDRIGEERKIAGVNTSTFLLGSRAQSSVPFHIEDVALQSLNLLHCGAEKVWLVIPPEDGRF
jgi:hypothetical protein